MSISNTSCDVTSKQLFVVFMGDLHEMGGGPLFVLEFIRYLEKLNWNILLISTGVPIGKNQVEELNKYIRYGNPVFRYKPSEFSEVEIDIIKNDYLREIKGKYKKVFVFSFYFEGALWGELFAKELGGKHVICDVNEPKEEVIQKYISYKDFFSFKYQRGEFYSTAGMTDYILNIFHMNHIKGDEIKEKMFYNPIQEYAVKEIEDIYRLDYNIAYIGRPNKPYFYHVLEAVREFALNRKDKQVQFLIMGDAKNYYEYICKRLLIVNNLKVVFLGVLFPIPKELYRKVDAVIAGSGSAQISAYEGKPVIVPNAINYMSNGIMGYTCDNNESVVSNNNTNRKIINDLEDALISKMYLKKPFIMPIKGESTGFCKQMMDRFNNKASIQYYNVRKKETNWREGNIKNIYRFVDEREIVSKLRTEKYKIFIFGAGSDGGLCRQWLEFIGVKVDAFVDSDNRKWNDGYINYGIPVMTPDILIDLVEEAIVIIASSNYSSSIWKWLDEKGISKNGNCIEFSQLNGCPII